MSADKCASGRMRVPFLFVWSLFVCLALRVRWGAVFPGRGAAECLAGVGALTSPGRAEARGTLPLTWLALRGGGGNAT